MKKNEKKREAAIVKALKDVCETLKVKYDGFVWLTHFVEYANFPQSLKIVFVFDTLKSFEDAKKKELFKTIFTLTESRLKRESVTIKRIDQAVYFDIEDHGANFNEPKWCKKYTEN